MLETTLMIIIVFVLAIDFTLTSLLHLNTFIQIRYLKIFDDQFELKLKTEIHEKSPEKLLEDSIIISNIQYQKPIENLIEKLYEKVFNTNLKNKFKKETIFQLNEVKLNLSLKNFSDNFSDKFLKSIKELNYFFTIIQWSYLIIGMTFALMFMIKAYSIFLADAQTIYAEGILYMNHFSGNMVAACKCILICLIALSTSKLLKKLLGVHKLEVLCNRIENNYHFNINRSRVPTPVEEKPPQVALPTVSEIALESSMLKNRIKS